MTGFTTPTGRLRWNAGVLEQEHHHAGRYEWREVPDVLPRRDELPPQISRPDVAAALATGEAPRVRLDGGREAAARADMATAVRATAEEIDPDFREVDEPACGAFYEFVCATRFRSTAPVQLEFSPGFWREVVYTRQPEPLRDTDRLTYETVAEILRSHSSPTMGAPGSVHGGQHGFVVYETDGLPFIVSRLAELATLDDGRTAKDMLHEQGSEIDRLKKLADYQAEEITRLEDTARLGLSDDPAAGATLAALTKERDELREKLPNFEAHVANLTREFHEELALVRRERDELSEGFIALDAKRQNEIRELRTAHDNARAALAASEREAAKLQTAIDAATAGNADIARDRDKWKARAVQAARERDNVGAKLAEVCRIAKR